LKIQWKEWTDAIKSAIDKIPKQPVKNLKKSKSRDTQIFGVHMEDGNRSIYLLKSNFYLVMDRQRSDPNLAHLEIPDVIHQLIVFLDKDGIFFND
jgi:hypothetical protein